MKLDAAPKLTQQVLELFLAVSPFREGHILARPHIIGYAEALSRVADDCYEGRD